jgi:hypothetical protein
MHQFYGYMLQELYAAIELLGLLVKAKNPPNMSVQLAQKAIVQSRDYGQLQNLMSDSSADNLKFIRHKLTAHRGISSLALEQLGGGRDNDLRASLLQLETLAHSMLSSEELLQALKRSFDPLLGIVRQLGSLSSYCLIPSAAAGVVFVIGHIDTHDNLSEMQKYISTAVEKLWLPTTGKLKTDYKLLRRTSPPLLGSVLRS